MRTVFSFIFILIALFSNGEEIDRSVVKFIQGNNSFSINKEIDSVVLIKEPFAIDYFCREYSEKDKKFYAAQIAVLSSYDDVKDLHAGQSLESIAYFEPGTGMAPDESNRYESIFITNDGHNYLYYYNEKDRRVDVISRHDNFMEFEWPVSKFYINDVDVTIRDIKFDVLYFVILINDNLNSTVDPGELKVVKVILK